MCAAVIKHESNLTPALRHSRKRCAEGTGGTEQSQRLHAFPGAVERLREMTAPIKTLQFTWDQKKPAQGPGAPKLLLGVLLAAITDSL